MRGLTKPNRVKPDATLFYCMFNYLSLQKTEIKEEKKDENEKKWDILREDYMMGAKMKDWNKSSSEDEDDDDDLGPPDQDLSDSD